MVNRGRLRIVSIALSLLSAAGRMDKMKKGIRCNETRFTNRDKRDRIRFEFVSDDEVTPSSCTVCVGDIDPMTGEKITDLTFFREYYRVVDHEVRENLKANRRKRSSEEEQRRESEKSGGMHRLRMMCCTIWSR